MMRRTVKLLVSGLLWSQAWGTAKSRQNPHGLSQWIMNSFCVQQRQKSFLHSVFLVLFVFFSGFAMPPWLLSPPPLSLWLVLFCGATRIMCKMFLAMFGSSFATLPVPVVVPVVPVVLVVVVVDRAGKLIFVQVDFLCVVLLWQTAPSFATISKLSLCMWQEFSALLAGIYCSRAW